MNNMSQREMISDHKVFSPHHSYQDARSKGHLVECGKGPSQVGGGHFLDVQWIKTHHQATEQTKHQPSQDENFK